MRTDREIIRDFANDVALTMEEKMRIVEMAKGCYYAGGFCRDECPLYVHSNEKGDASCLDFFVKFIIGGDPRCIPPKTDTTNLNELANNCIKICNEIKMKTKRETPMQVVVSHSNGKTIYHCYNCGKPLFIQQSTQYCECCGQKLSFEVIENEI